MQDSGLFCTVMGQGSFVSAGRVQKMMMIQSQKKIQGNHKETLILFLHRGYHGPAVGFNPSPYYCPPKDSQKKPMKLLVFSF